MFRCTQRLVCALVAVLLTSHAHVQAAPAVMGLTAREAEPRNQGDESGYLVRELLRQSVLIAARDGLGLSTRDETLRESLPETGADALTLELYWDTAFPKPISFWITSQGDGTRLYEKEFKREVGRELGYMMNPRALAILAEPLSRTELVEVLKKAGLEGKPNRSNEAVEVPADIQQQLQEMNIFSQYAAVPHYTSCNVPRENLPPLWQRSPAAMRIWDSSPLSISTQRTRPAGREPCCTPTG